MPEEKQRTEPFGGLQVRVRLVKEGSTPYSSPIRCPEDVVELVSEIRWCDREAFLTLAMDIRNRVLGVEVTAIGTLTTTPVAPREVFKAALLANAEAVLFVHVHPSGKPDPSPEDMAITLLLVKGARILGLEVHDHIIIGHECHYSFAEAGLLEQMKETVRSPIGQGAG